MTQRSAGSYGVPAGGRNSELLLRTLSALALAALALGGAVLGGWATALVLAIVASVAHLEWGNLTDRSPWPTLIFTGCLVVAIGMIAAGMPLPGFVLVALAIGTAALTMSLWRPVGIVYAAALGTGLLVLRLSPEGLPAVVVVLATVWATDTGAFFAGRAIGGPKLWPSVSPKKTWAGAVGGLAAGVVAGLVAAAAAGVILSPALALIVAVLSVSAQAGDLFESWVKRRFGAKDASNLVPGHGGLLDRVDGLAVASGVAACVGWLHAGPDLARGLLLW